jgi:hypothetical protein
MSPFIFSNGVDPQTLVGIGDGKICGRTAYGFVSTDSGTKTVIFRRIGIFDMRLFAHQASDPYPEHDFPIPSAWTGAVSRCEEAFSLRKNLPG